MKKIVTPIILFTVFSTFSIAQQNLQFDQCQDLQFEINDHSDTDNDGNVCEAKILLSKSASYVNGDCQMSEIKWVVYVDLLNDGVVDLEYNSELPASDNDLDDTNGNGIPDLYIPMTTTNEIQNIPLPDIEGPLSEHHVEWKVFDSCDNEEVCQSIFQVIDKRAPTPYCSSLSTIAYNGDTANEIYAEDFNVGSFDNCTVSEDLIISFSPDDFVPSRVLNCEDVLNSPIELDIYFTDLSGNTDYCRTFLNVVQGSGADCNGDKEIRGKVNRWNGEPLVGVKVILDADLPEFPIETYTDGEGNYSFGFLPELVDYTLSATKEDPYVAGVSTLDLVIIVRHILGLESFTNPYRILAADVNGDGQVKASDLLIHRKLILGVISEITTNEVWDFVRSDFDITNPLNPVSLLNASANQFNYEFNSISSDGYDFIGAKAGDITE